MRGVVGAWVQCVGGGVSHILLVVDGAVLVAFWNVVVVCSVLVEVSVVYVLVCF